MKTINKILTGFVLIIFLTSLNANADIIKTGAANVPLSDRISLDSYAFTAVSSDVDIDDYMLDASTVYFPLGEKLEAGAGKTGGGSGTSYVSLEGSTVLGTYASEPQSWAEYAFSGTTFGSVTESIANQTQSDPGLVAVVIILRRLFL